MNGFKGQNLELESALSPIFFFAKKNPACWKMLRESQYKVSQSGDRVCTCILHVIHA